jgi:hypothetical protein
VSSFRIMLIDGCLSFGMGVYLLVSGRRPAVWVIRNDIADTDYGIFYRGK